jgi:hypothetical protein
MLDACYRHPMSNLQVKNVPPALHAKLRRLAEREGRSLRDFVLDALRREVGRRELADRLARRSPVDLGRPAARSLVEARQERDRELGS